MDHAGVRLLASAIAGQALDVIEGTGPAAWTDGLTVHLDPGLPHADVVAAIAVQASMVAAGSLSPDVIGGLQRRPAVARRYLAVEGHRALAANEAVLPPMVLRWLDRSVAALASSPQASLALARGRAALPAPPHVFGELRIRSLLAAAERAAAPGAQAGPMPSSPGRRPAELEVIEDDLDGDDDLGDLLSSPVGGGGPVGKLLGRLLRSARARSGGGPPGADAPTHVGGARPGGARRSATASAEVGPAGDLHAAAHEGAAYPEWDVHRRRYRPAWCTVVEHDPKPAEGSAPPPRDELGLHRPLARLGIGLERCRRQRQGDDLDVDAVVATRVEAAAGHLAEDSPVYVESLRRRRDLSVLVLLDVSGSAAELGTAGRPVHEHQRRAAASLAAALHGLGDRVAVYAFNSRGRQAVQLLRVKGFDDRLDASVGRRFAGLIPGAYTRLGAAIRHSATIVDERAGTPRRLLVVLSDGFAYDHGYEGRYGEADARRALLEARRRGVGCLCLSVGTDVEPAALRRVFGTAAHATVPRVEELPAVVGPLFRAAMRSAEAQHRTFQRTERTRERLTIERRTDGSGYPPLLRTGR